MGAIEPVKVLQITDTHLGAAVGTRLLGMDTDDSLSAVIDLAARQHGDNDYLLGTGDIALSGEPESYERFQHYVTGLAKQHAWIPGNHDLPAQMAAARSDWVRPRIDAGDWQIIMLDSTIPGEVGGELGADQLAHLRECLTKNPEQAALICLHHHARPVCSDWLDGQCVRNSDALFELLTEFDQPRVILGGHVHQEQDYLHAGIRILATPSTCVQFKPNSEDFGLDDCNPGYRWLHLYPKGRLETGVERVTDRTFDVDRAAAGY